MFYGHVMCFHLQHPERSEIFIFSGLSLSRRSNSEKLTRLKIAADNLIVFAGEFFYRRNRRPKGRSRKLRPRQEMNKQKNLKFVSISPAKMLYGHTMFIGGKSQKDIYLLRFITVASGVKTDFKLNSIIATLCLLFLQ